MTRSVKQRVTVEVLIPEGYEFVARRQPVRGEIILGGTPNHPRALSVTGGFTYNHSEIIIKPVEQPLAANEWWVVVNSRKDPTDGGYVVRLFRRKGVAQEYVRDHAYSKDYIIYRAKTMTYAGEN